MLKIFSSIIIVFIFCFDVHAQTVNDTIPPVKDSIITTTDTSIIKADTAAVTTKKPKEIKRLDDLEAPEYLLRKIQAMNADQMLDIDEEIRENIKNKDGENFTVITKIIFAQDGLLGYVKTVPMGYDDEYAETQKIKIAVKFCCTGPMDSVHTQQHCGFMSELNRFEDLYKCKGWAANFESTGKTRENMLNPRQKAVKQIIEKKPTKKDVKQMKADAKKESIENARKEPAATDEVN